MAEVEHSVQIIELDDKFQEKLKELEKEGWELIPGVQPIAVYHLARHKRVPAVAQNAQGNIQIDETKVHILRDGKLVQ